jgi:AmmeMemoRadiSam system protein B
MDRPKLRNVERIPHDRDGVPHVILRDAMGVADPVAIDADFVPVLDALDGSRTLAQIRQSLRMTKALDVPLDDLVAFAASLEDAGLLEGDAFRRRWLALHDAFLATDVRAPTLAGTLYPDDPTALRQALHDALGPPDPAGIDTSALLVPHGPLELVGRVLRPALAGLPRADAIDVVLLLGTDHHPGLLPCAVLDKGYQTPLGRATAATDEIDALVRRVPWLDREAIRHRTAHSLEWATLYLQHVWGAAMPPVVPLLCGAATFGKDGGLHPDMPDVVAALDGLIEGGRVLVVAAAELTHAGPAYGRRDVDADGLVALADRDRRVVAAAARGRTLEAMHAGADLLDQGRPSGLATLALLSELVTSMRLRSFEYELVPIPALAGRSLGAVDAPSEPPAGLPSAACGWLGCASARFGPVA